MAEHPLAVASAPSSMPQATLRPPHFPARALPVPPPRATMPGRGQRETTIEGDNIKEEMNG
jgi:hypothetical protein